MNTKWNLLIVLALLATLAGGTAGTAQAAPGDLDPGFAVTGGRLVIDATPPPGGLPAGRVVAARQSTGQIIAIGRHDSQTIAVYRYNADGTADNTFGNGTGVAVTEIGGGAIPQTVAVDGSNYILVAAQYSAVGVKYAVLVRYTPNGALDTTFGAGGILSITPPGGFIFAEAAGVGILPSGQIILAGYGSVPESVDQGILLGFDTHGQPDLAFGTGGMVTYGEEGVDVRFTSLEASADILVPVMAGSGPTIASFVQRYNATGALVQQYQTVESAWLLAVHGMPDGTVYAAGATLLDPSAMLVRYGSDGDLDSSFDNDGMATAGSDAAIVCHSLLVQADNITLACLGMELVETTNYSRFTLWRVGMDGTPVSTFGTGGIVQTRFDDVEPWMTNSSAQTLLPVGTDKLLAVGAVSGSSSVLIALAQYDNATGALDTTFAPTGGRLVTDLPALNVVKGRADSAVQSTGGIIVGSDNGPDYVIHRFNADGTMDNSFIAETPYLPASTNKFATAIVVDQYDRILTSVYGYDESADFSWGALVRYTADGALDDTFGGGDGVVTLTDSGITWPEGYAIHHLNDMAIQSDGGFILSGAIWDTSKTVWQAFLLRFEADGNWDMNFGAGGMVLWHGGEAINSFRDVDIAADDAILAAAYSMEDSSGNEVYNATIMRYTAAGVLDKEFAEHAGQYWAMQPLPDGAVLAAGWATDEMGSRLGLLVRYQPDGAFDSDFGTNGEILFLLGDYFTEITAMLLQPDGKIVLGAEADIDSKPDFTILRLNADGTNDSTFGIITTLFNGVDESFLRSLILTPGDKILATGYATLSKNGTPYVAMAQYDPGAFNDITAPTITYDIQGTQGSSGWYTSDVTLSWTVEDAGSAFTSTGCDTVTINADQQDTAYTCEATSAGGTNSVTVHIKRDANGPVLAPSVKPNPVLLNGSATASPNATDATSGVSSSNCEAVDTSSVGAHSIACTATDNAGNIASANASYNVILPADTTPPAITPVIQGTLGQNGWYTSNVTLSWTVTDNESEFTSTGCGQVTITADQLDTAYTCTATSAGGTNSVTVHIKRDANGPVLAPSVTPNPVLLNGSATANPNATDATSGVASSNCDAVNTSSIGSHSVNCTATDNAGNTATASATYRVTYNFIGFTSPVDNPGVINIAKAGQTIPLKFRITDANGNPVTNLTSVTVTVASLACSAGTTTDLIEEYATGASGLQNLGNGYYQWNWKTPTSYANSCKTLKLNLGEGAGFEHIALFQLKK